VTDPANFSGTDTFVANLRDEHGAVSADTTISIIVSPVNDAPVAADDQFMYTSGAAPLDVVANDSDVDGDALLASILEPPNIGTVSLANNRVTYQPPANYSGPAMFKYRISDAAGAVADATARLVVSEFPGMLVIDGPTPSYRKLSFYDGFRIQFLSTEGPIPRTEYSLILYLAARDRRSALYVVPDSQADAGSLYLFDLARPRDRATGTPDRILQTGMGRPVIFSLAANHDAFYVLAFADRPSRVARPRSQLPARAVPAARLCRSDGRIARFSDDRRFQPGQRRVLRLGQREHGAATRKEQRDLQHAVRGAHLEPRLDANRVELCTGRRRGLGAQCSSMTARPTPKLI
jgi:Bacterial Ig domain